jgi:hypothetical protein
MTTIPYSEEAEKAVLGCFVSQPDLFEAHGNELVESDFFDPSCRNVFRAICKLADTEAVIRIEALVPILSREEYGLLAEAMGISIPDQVKKEIGSIRRDSARRRRLEEMEVEKRRILAREDEPSIGNGSKLSVRNVAELLAMTFDSSDNWMGDRVMAAGQNVTLLGPGGIGKSRLVLQMALCMVMGREFLGLTTHARGKRWLFLQTENSNRRLQDDLAKMLMALKPSSEEIDLINASIFIHTIETDADGFLDVENSQVNKEIAALIAQIQPDIVAWDPLNTCTSLDLNSDQDMRQVVTSITMLTKKGNPSRIPLILHHSLTGKAGAARAVGWDKASYGRNSKALQAWTRAQMNLAPRDPDDSTLLLLACGKNNNGAPFPDIGIKYHEMLGLYQIDSSFDPAAFRDEMGMGGKKVEPCPVQAVVEVVGASLVPVSKLDLYLRLRDDTGASKATIYRRIDAAYRAKQIGGPINGPYQVSKP